MVLVNSSNPETSIHFSLLVGLAGEFLHGLICFGTPDEKDWIIDDDPTGDIVLSRTRLLLSFLGPLSYSFSDLLSGARDGCLGWACHWGSDRLESQVLKSSDWVVKSGDSANLVRISVSDRSESCSRVVF